MVRRAEIVIFDSEEEYKQEYIKIFVNGGPFSLRGISIIFDEKSFDHIFFEPEDDSNKKGKFSARRSKKMHFLKAMLNEEVNIEIMYQSDRGTFAVFCIDLDCVMYLRNRVGTQKLQIGTFIDFGKDHTKMCEKQKKKCVPIDDKKFRSLVK